MISAFGVEHVAKSQLANGAYKAITALSDAERSSLKWGGIQTRKSNRMVRLARGPKQASENTFSGAHLDKLPTRPSAKVKNLHFGPDTQPHHAAQLEHMLAGRKLKRPITAHVDPKVGRELGDGGVTVTRPKHMNTHVILGGRIFDEEPAHAERIVHHEFTHANRTGHSQLNATHRFGGGMTAPNEAHMREEARADHVSARFSSSPTSYEQGRTLAGTQPDNPVFHPYRAHREHLNQVAKSAFGIEHIVKGKAGKVHYDQIDESVDPWGKHRIRDKQQQRISRKFAAKYGPGEHDVPVRALRRLSGSQRTMGTLDHDARVAAIKPSMAERGLESPVAVARYKPLIGSKKHKPHAAFEEGGHRLIAARQLGWKTVRTVVVDSASVRKSAFGVRH